MRPRLAECMSAMAGAMPQLEQLFLSLGNSCKVTWATQLPAILRELGLHVRSGKKLKISCSLSALTQVTELLLSASVIQIKARVQLPPSIRTLSIHAHSHAALPSQAS